MEDLQKLQRNTEQKCALKLVIDNSESLLELENILIPYLLQSEPLYKFNKRFQRSYYRASCWVNFIEISSIKDIKQIMPYESSFDYYIFISSDTQKLETFLAKHLVLDMFARKHGMIIPKSLPLKVTYLVDSEIYSGSFTKTNSILFKKKLHNLNGRVISIPYQHLPPYFHRETDNIKGIENHLLTEMSKRTNFTPKYYSNIKYPGTGMLVNGTWTGCMGELVSGRGEITPILAISLERFPAVTQSEQILYSSMVFVVREGEAEDQWHTFKYLAIIFNITFLALFLCRSKLLKWAKINSRNYARTMFVIWTGVFAFVGVTCRCRLTAFLTISEKVKTPSTLKELYEQGYSTVLWRVGDGGMEMEMIRTSQNPVVKALRKHMKYEQDILKCLKIAAESNSKKACVGWRPSLEMMIAKHSAFHPSLKQLRTSEDTVDIVTCFVGLKRGSIFVETVNRYILAARSGNLEVKWEKDIYVQLREAAQEKLRHNFSTLKVSKQGNKKKNKLALIASMLYLVLSFGYGVSLTVLAFEMVKAYFRNLLSLQRILI